MLRLVTGTAGTGKTTTLVNEMAKRAACGLYSILLVPEQFSSSAEAAVYAALGDRGCGFAQVRSFRTLAERILRESGGLAVPVLTEAGRTVYVRRALDAVGGRMGVFARVRRSTAFCSLCARTLAELKTAGATPAALRGIAEAQGDAKLTELALVFEAYEAAIDGSAVDPEDRLLMAARRAEARHFGGTALFVDGFDGFTAPEYTLLEVLLGLCADVSVALCCDAAGEAPDGPTVFAPVRAAARRLMGMAARAGVPVAPPLALREARRPLAGGVALAGRLAGGMGAEEGAEPRADGVYYTECADEWEEARLCAAEMRRLALCGVPFAKMAFVCRDIGRYESAVRYFCTLYDIPLFVDATATIEHTAPVNFLRAALAILRDGLTSRGVLALLKSGLCGCAEGDLAAVENYAFVWEPKAAEWRAPFDRNPRGLLAPADAEAAQELAAAEGLRGRVIPIIEEFAHNSKGVSAEELSKQLYLLMESFGAPAHAAAGIEREAGRGDAALADVRRREWDLCMELLSQMAALVGGESLSAAEYDELFLLLVRCTEFGSAPLTLECAVLAGADRMRLWEPETCFVLGLCEGDFPMQPGYSGLLTHADRERLVAGGIEMPGSFENRVHLEEMFFYRAMCAARSRLYLSRPLRLGGAAKITCTALRGVLREMCPPPLAPAPETLAATPAAAFRLLADSANGGGALAPTLRAALEGEGGAHIVAKLAMLRCVNARGDFNVSDPAALRALLGEELNLSATTVERYYSCPFSYYMERVLRARPPRRAQVSPLESGTFVHHILERVTGAAGVGLREWGNAALRGAAEEAAGRFAAENGLAATRRDAWRLRQITAATVRLLEFLRDAAAQSEFVTDAVELDIGADIPALVLRRAGGGEVRVRGKVDRVDVLRSGGQTYLCVVDYKTGDKLFSLADVYFGHNMQMLIYLNALCKNSGGRYPCPRPAGVLYLAADPAPRTGPRGGAAAARRADGLVLWEPRVLRALEPDGGGKYLPVRRRRDGTPYAGGHLASPETFEAVAGHVEKLITDMAERVYAGEFCARPAVRGGVRPCAVCPYRAACRHEDGRDEPELRAPDGVFGTGGGAEEAGV